MRFRTERERQEYEQFLEADRAEQTELAARIEAPLKLEKLKKELAINAGKLIREKRKQALGYVENPYISPDLPYLETDEEIAEFNRKEASAFYDECAAQGWYGSQENIDALTQYFINRNIQLVDCLMWKSAFLALQKSGLLEERPAPAPAPVTVQVPQQREESLPRLPLGHSTHAAWKREATEKAYRGIDPNTGSPKDYTRVEIDRMDAETFRKVFNVPVPALTRVNFHRR
jgi:hypothetical protein